MSADSDIADAGRHLTQMRKKRHAEWKKKNTEAVIASGVPHTSINNGETLLFRDNGLCVDFYPSTGR